MQNLVYWFVYYISDVAISMFIRQLLYTQPDHHRYETNSTTEGDVLADSDQIAEAFTCSMESANGQRPGFSTNPGLCFLSVLPQISLRDRTRFFFDIRH